MILTTEQADALIFTTALAALYYDEDQAIIDEGATAYADVGRAMQEIADVSMTDEERETLRVLCGRAIVDPTAYRSDFTDYVLAATEPGTERALG